MKTIVFAPETLNLAETSRMLVVAKACQGKFDALFTSYGGDFERLVEAAGHPIRKLTPRLTPEKIDLFYRVDRMESFEEPFTVAEITERVRNEIALLREVKPAAVVMGFTLTMVISARAAGVPLVIVMPFAGTLPFYRAGLGTWPDAFDYPWLRWIPAASLNRLSNWWLLNTRMWISRFNQVARAYGVPELKVALELFEGDYTLVTDTPDITGVAHLPPNHRYVGPIIARLEGEVPPEILSLPHDQPIVYFAMGSSGNPRIVREILPGFGERPYRVIAPIKSHLDGSVRIPENVLVTDWLPAHKVNPLADISVIHGGQGTVQTACLSGTPIVGVGMQPEQEANLDFLVRKGMAIRIRKRRVTARAVLAAVDRLLNDAEAKRRAREVQQALQGWDGPGNAAGFLEQTFEA